MKLVAPIFLLIPSVLFAREVSSAFLWDAIVDSGRVITGSTDETSGYWYAFDDGVDGGTSTWIWPSDIEEDVNGDIFGPLTRAYGSIFGEFALGEQCVSDGQKYSCSVGIGFNTWDENQQGVDVSAWNGLCLEYSATSDVGIRLRRDNPLTLDLFVSVAASDSLSVVNIPWRKFSWYDSMFNPFETIEECLLDVGAVQLLFLGNSGATGNFKLTKIGSLGTCDGSFTAVPQPRVFFSVGLRQIAPRTFSLDGLAVGSVYKVFDLNGNLLQRETWNGEAFTVERVPAVLRVQGKAYLLR
ncbi:hypothetical protein [Fibrobacter intestinalis]|uniref:hypothetical protein n=1 Tax=Fibrobacter intestinalis TaxID=28122 RepID=UPI0023F117E8|nr:hypothetical protein [Fibrobacter intestinalis]MDD7299718.1 hypothetical protein [Fibrobacter intestinalis]